MNLDINYDEMMNAKIMKEIQNEFKKQSKYIIILLNKYYILTIFRNIFVQHYGYIFK